MFISKRSWTGAQTQQIITSTTGTPPGGMAKEDIISDIKERHHCDIVQNSAESSEHRPGKLGRCSP